MVATEDSHLAFLDTPNCRAAGDRQQQSCYVLGLGRWNTFGTHIANIEESPRLALGFFATDIKN
jgi:hypothetical protein